MSEWIFACLLRLYPSHFRVRYGSESLLLVRDRLHDEKGLSRRLRLWFDLLLDFAFALPRTHSASSFGLAGPAALAEPVGFPQFGVLEHRPPRPSSLLYASLLTLVTFGPLFVWVGQARNYRELRGAPGGSAAWAMSSQDPKPAAQTAEPRVEDATAAVIHAFDTHSIVMFGETHANKQEYEWLCKLVATPAFADRVDDIVVEFGNSLYQKSVDRYIAGEDVPMEQVEKAWRNMVGSVGAPSPVYQWLYEAVRRSNMSRRGSHRMRIVLGDPYGDWDWIKNAEDLGPFVSHRDEWYATVVKDEVLAKNHRAFLIMGAGHFRRHNGPALVESEIRSAGANPWVIIFGTNAVGGYDDLDKRFDSWPAPAIVSLAGNWVGDLPAMPVLSGGIMPANGLKLADTADALFYAGSRDAMIQVNMPRSELVGTAYGTELARRLTIQMGHPGDFPAEAEGLQFHRPPPQSNPSGPHGMMVAPPQSMNDPLPPRPPSQ